MVLGAFVTYVSRSSCAAQPRTSRPFLRAGADFGARWCFFLVRCALWVRRYWAPRTCTCVCCRCTHSCYYYHTSQTVLPPPEAGQVPATRRSEATTPRPRAGCPPASAAGLIMTPKRDARGQHELSARAYAFRWLCSTGCMLKFVDVSSCHASVKCCGGPPYAAAH